MNRLSIIYLTILILFSNIATAADEITAPHSAITVKPVVLEVGISMSIPPWVIRDTNSGIELDILRASLSEDRYEIKPVYLPFARAYKQFESQHLDAVMNAKANVVKGGFLSDPVVTFNNYAISLASKNFPKQLPMSFLYDKEVIGFQKSKALLGEEYAQMASSNKRYKEVSQQDLQINLLFIREADFIVMDKSIFGYYWYQATQNKQFTPQNSTQFKKHVRFHSLFAPSPYPFLFQDKAVRDDFNLGLQKLRESGEYQAIIDRYDHLSDMYVSP